jgi:hypothetical protein
MDTGWTKPSLSYSNGNCVEVAWRTAGASNGHSPCVEAGGGICGVVHVRDSKDPDGPVLTFPPGTWQAFLAGVKAGELGLA